MSRIAIKISDIAAGIRKSLQGQLVFLSSRMCSPSGLSNVKFLVVFMFSFYKIIVVIIYSQIIFREP